MTKENVIIWDRVKIREARIARGLTEEEATTLLNITPVYLNMLETGKRQPSPRTVTKLSSIYRKPISHFLIDEKNLALA